MTAMCAACLLQPKLLALGFGRCSPLVGTHSSVAGYGTLLRRSVSYASPPTALPRAQNISVLFIRVSRVSVT
ncbi:hypothetical protein KC19_VG086000 [Ceratodon purpureus]|uniref:Secreted protein n=1 Tax=Ceratodon purpureus TaxID=3225 RepID=A0A8T0HNA6_CERPU|nr:hypothetical protein KC19_VG086000 [Ceratodon purpureus]